MTSIRKTKGRPTDIDKIIGSNLLKIRKAKGFSQTRLGKELDITFQQVQKYETGVNRISASMLFKISEAINVPILDFYKGVIDVQDSFLDDISDRALKLAIALDKKGNKELIKSIEKLIA